MRNLFSTVPLPYLNSRGYRVITAPNGLEGLKIALAEKPDMILCDISMPELDGYEVLEKNPRKRRYFHLALYISHSLYRQTPDKGRNGKRRR
jgi:CheY-like chemotaxis protein